MEENNENEFIEVNIEDDKKIKDDNIGVRVTKEVKRLWEKVSYKKDKEEVLKSALNALILEEKEGEFLQHKKAIDNFTYHTRAITNEYSNLLQILEDTEGRIKVQFKEEIERVNKSNLNLLNEKNALLEEINSYKEINTSLIIEREEFKNSIDDLEKMIKEYDENLKQSNYTNIELRERFEEYREFKVKSKELEQQNLELISDIKKKDYEISKIFSENKEKNTEIKLLNKDLETQIKLNNQINEELSKLENINIKLNNKLEEEKNTVAILNIQQSNLNLKLQAANKDLETYKATKLKQEEVAIKDIKNLELIITESKKENKELKNELKKLNDKINKLQEIKYQKDELINKQNINIIELKNEFEKSSKLYEDQIKELNVRINKFQKCQVEKDEIISKQNINIIELENELGKNKELSRTELNSKK